MKNIFSLINFNKGIIQTCNVHEFPSLKYINEIKNREPMITKVFGFLDFAAV